MLRHSVESISIRARGTTSGSSTHLKTKNSFVSFEIFLFLIASRPSTQKEPLSRMLCLSLVCASVRFELSFAPVLNLLLGLDVFAHYINVKEPDCVCVCRLSLFALSPFCFIPISAHTRDSLMFPHRSIVRTIMIYPSTLNCLLPFSMVLFLVFPYFELNPSPFSFLYSYKIEYTF